MSSITDNSVSDDSYFKKLQKQIPDAIGCYQPNIFPLGYFIKRSEPRLLYVMPLTMLYDGEKYSVKSKNISMNGLQVFIPRTLIHEGKIVQISFDKFIQDQNTLIGGIDEFTPYKNINYLIKEVKHVGEKTYISLIQVDLPFSTMDFFKRFIAGSRLRYKIDASDQVCASKAQYYENLYTVNMQHVPMFIHWTNDLGFYIDTIIKTDRNISFFDYISNNGHEAESSIKKGKPQFNAFCIPQRIEKFAEMAQGNESSILFTYWEHDKFHSVFDFELASSDEMLQITVKVKTCRGRIYKTLTNLNKKPAAEKITAMLSKIQKIDAMASKVIEKRTSESIAQVIFADITKVFLRQNIFSKALKFKPGHALSLSVVCNNQRIAMADGHVFETFDENLFHLPDIVLFNIEHHRYDPRYQYEMDVTVKFNNRIYSATTIDFSRAGLGMVIRQEVDITKDSSIEITFSSLMIKGITTQLKDIPHRVMIARKRNDGLFLGVIRNTSHCHQTINQFFSNLVKRNKSKLHLCVKDKIDTVNTTFYEAFVTENIQTIPIVITRDRNKQHYIREIGLTETPCGLAEKLYIGGHGYDFRFLTTELRLNEFHQRAVKASDKNSQSFMLFLLIEENEFGRKSIFSITDFELIQQEQLDVLINFILKNNGVCINVKFMNDLVFDKLYRNMTIDKVEKLNKSSAKLLAQEYKEIIGFAEMIDLTDEYRKLYQ
ncbi:MAG: PilZ domain-containing protein [Gammaproteobacteria bacterium]|nr:PilZ domain-containing protein [Gammaproteobacteria bacterium]